MFETGASANARVVAFALQTLTVADQLSNGIAAVDESAIGTKRTFAAVQCNVRYWG